MAEIMNNQEQTVQGSPQEFPQAVPSGSDVDAEAVSPIPVRSDSDIVTDIAIVGDSTSLQLTTSFDDVLNAIPVQLAAIDNLLSEYRSDKEAFFDKYDEDEIDAQLKTLRDLNGFTRNIDSAKADIRKFLDERKKQLLQAIDLRLENADFSRLKIAESDIKKLRNDLIEHRKATRWREVEDIFNDAFSTQEGIAVKQYLPALADIKLFKENHPDFVSGAKSKNVTKADKTYIRNLVTEYAHGLSMIQQNSWGLSDKYLAKLMSSYESNPDFLGLNQLGIAMAAEEVAEAQREFERRQAEEAERKRKEEVERLAAENAKRLQEARQVKPQVTAAAVKPVVAPKPAPSEPVRKEPQNDFSSRILMTHRTQFGQVLQYIENDSRYANLHANPQQKAALIWECMASIMDEGSIFYKEFGTNSVKILSFIRFVLDI